VLKAIWNIAPSAAAVAVLTSIGPQALAACEMNAVPLAVKMVRMKPIVSVQLEGQERRFIVDSGAFYSSVSAKFAVEQKMKPVNMQRPGLHLAAQATVLTNGFGDNPAASVVVQADEFDLGGMRLKNWKFLTYDGPEEPAGLIGQDILHQIDVEYDLAHGSIKLMDVKDCKDVNLAYWTKPEAGPSVLPMESTQRGNEHVEAIVTINGVKMDAVFDTGAAQSILTKDAARRARVHVTDPGVREGSDGYDINGNRFKIWSAPFASVKIGGEEIKNGRLLIGDTAQSSYDLVIGADFFMAHHVYVANSQQKIYFTYNGGQVFNVTDAADASQP
jgi:predicted aspartyl protease